MRMLKILLPLAVLVVLSGCVIYTFADMGPYDFEDDYIPVNFDEGSTTPWSLDYSDGADYTDQSLKSGSPAAGASSTLILTISAGLADGKDIHFYYKMDAAGSSDTLTLYVNDFQEWSVSGDSSYWNQEDVYDSEFLIDGEGPNVFKWVYTRSSSSTVAFGENCAWIDLVEIDG